LAGIMGLSFGACSEPVEQAEMDVPAAAAETTRPEKAADRNAVNIDPKAEEAAKSRVEIEQTLPVPAIRKTRFNVRRCINLGNALEAEHEGAWGYTIRATDIERIKQAGFDTIRLPVRWDYRTQNIPPYKIDPDYMKRVRTIVDQAQVEGLGVIIDVHHYRPLFKDFRAELPRFTAIWEQIAAEFKHAPDNIYFEPLNEPFPQGDKEHVNLAYKAVLPVIRRSNPSRIVILGGAEWSHVESMAWINWPDDPNIVATFHDYGPHEFTHQGNSWEDNPPPAGQVWGSKKDRADMMRDYKIAREFRAKQGVPVLLGEFGVINNVDNTQRVAWTKARRKAAEASLIPWCVWDFSGSFSLYDTEAEQWNGPLLDALMGD